MASSSIAARQLSDGNSDGTILGQSTSDRLGFYGVATPQAQVTVVGTNTTGLQAVAILAPTTAAGISTWGFSSQAQANMVISTMTALYNLGIIG